MDFVKLNPEFAAQWDNLVHQSEDGWLFGLFSWQKMAVEVPQWGFEDYSFGVLEAGRWKAVMPLQLTMDGRLCSLPMGASGPVVEPGISESEREGILAAIFDRTKRIAKEQEAHQIEVFIPPLSGTSLSGPGDENFLVRHGFSDASTHSWIIDLRRPKEQIRENISRNARRKIKEAGEKGYKIRPIENRAEMDVYYEIHCETYHRTGVAPHPKEYFLGIYDRFTQTGLSKIWVATDGQGRPVAFTNIGIFKRRALYWTTCCRNEDYRNGVYYLLLWHAIESAKDGGMEWFDCAEAFPDAPAGSKEKGLSDFKRKFGGELHRYSKGRLVLNGSCASSKVSLPRRVLRGLRDVRKKVEAFVGKEAADFLAAPVRAALDVVQTVRGPHVGFLKPYWKKEEFSIAAEGVQSGDEALKCFSDLFRRRLGFGEDVAVVLTGSGRTALEVALRVLKQKNPGRREVIIPSYGCKGTFDPIVKAGLIPVFADINEDLLTEDTELRKRFSSATLAVLLVHLCGKHLDTRGIVKDARERGIAAIEDHCQNTGGKSSVADISIYAFGMGKNAMATAGGAVVGAGLQDEFKSESLRLAGEEVESARRRFSYYDARYFHPKDFEKLRRSGDIPSEESRAQHDYVRMNPLDALLMIEQFHKLDEIIELRRKNAGRLLTKLRKFPDLFGLQSSEEHLYTKLSVRLKDRRSMRRFAEWMVRRGVELETTYVPLHLRHFGSVFRRECLPCCEAIHPLIVNLPVRPNLSARELRKVETAIEEYGRAHSRA